VPSSITITVTPAAPLLSNATLACPSSALTAGTPAVCALSVRDALGNLTGGQALSQRMLVDVISASASTSAAASGSPAHSAVG